jgi:virginiamycin A acetyltransferase
MNVKTSDDCIGVLTNHPSSNQFVVIGYKDGAVSAIPKDLFRNGRDEAVEVDSLQIGRCSMLGAGSIVKCGEGAQRLVIGKHVAGGLRLRFLLSDPQSTHTLCAVPFGPPGFRIDDAPAPNYPDTVIHHDVSIGDEAMLLGGSVIKSGCVIARDPSCRRTFSASLTASTKDRRPASGASVSPREYARSCSNSLGGTCRWTGSSSTARHF